MKRILKTRGKWAFYAFSVLAMLFTAAPSATGAADNPLSFTVEQVVTASPADEGVTFTYSLKPLDADHPLPPGSTGPEYTFSISGNSSVKIGPISFIQQGVYHYELSQVSGPDKAGFSADKRVYTAEVHVGVGLNVVYAIRNEIGAKVDVIRFVSSNNTSPGSPDKEKPDIPKLPLPTDPALMADPPVKKTVEGRPSTNSTFTFRLTARNDSSPMPAGSKGGVKEIHVQGAGTGEFGAWSYHEAGVYYYTVTELNAGEKGYAYDTSVYTITDRVEEKNGRLVLSRVVTNALNKPVTSLTYINKYSPGADSTDNAGPAKGDNPLLDIEGDATPRSGWIIGMPKTGDDSNTTFYIAMLALGGAMAISAAMYLAVLRKRRNIRQV
jgi:pilin isopeptide linkage protein/LPXTG-motif cell wall-anchored protein